MSNFRRYYQKENTVFITIVTYNRQPILIKNINHLRTSIKSVKYNFNIIAGIVLPDHMHILIKPDNANEIPKIIASFKANFSKNFSTNNTQSKEQINRREKGIWQRKYYDHIIRNEEDLHKHIDYIHYNSIKHHNIKPKDWEYSSFKKFVENQYYDIDWCNFNDKHNILSMNLE